MGLSSGLKRLNSRETESDPSSDIFVGKGSAWGWLVGKRVWNSG